MGLREMGGLVWAEASATNKNTMADVNVRVETRDKTPSAKDEIWHPLLASLPKNNASEAKGKHINQFSIRRG